MTRTKRLWAIALAVTAALAVVPQSSAHATRGRPKLTWTTCAGASNPDLRCARVTVPLDYRRPYGRKIQIMISRLPATDPAQRRGVLLTTQGGPGLTGGLFLPEDYVATLSPRVLARYDLIGFDVRFVEQSTPITCGRNRNEPEGFWNRAATSRQVFDEQVTEARRYAKECERAAGWALPHATIANIARDMDAIRAALGERKISFLGTDSAATAAATYATLYPRRVDRFVLDSPFHTDNLWREFKMDRTATFEEGLDRYTAWIAARHSDYDFGTTAEDVEATITDMWKRAPIPAGGRDWTSDELVYYTLLGVFFEVFFEIMADNLAAINRGESPPAPFELYPTPRPGVTGVPADNHTAASTAYQCGDNAWPRDVESYWRDVRAHAARHPNFGLSHANIFPCAFWRTRADNRIPLSGTRAPAMLMASAVVNAVTPLAEVRRVARDIRGSRLIVDDQQSHVLVPFFGSACLNNAVTDYLVTGHLPPADIFCPRTT